MKSEYQDYMEFLKSFVQGTPLTLSDNVDWSSIMKMAQINNTTGIIGYMFMSNPGAADPGLTSVGRHPILILYHPPLILPSASTPESDFPFFLSLLIR